MFARKLRQIVVVVCLAVGLGLLAACAGVNATQTGTLAGHVTIGPLTPVERSDQPTPTPNPEIFLARKVVIFSADSSRQVAVVSIDAQGNYQIELPPASYRVDIQSQGMDRGINLPQIVVITAGQTTRLDLDIDTGMR